MRPDEFRKIRLELGLTQEELARRLQTTRMTVTRYEGGTRRIPGVVDVVIRQLLTHTRIPMAGVVAAGRPLEAIPQAELLDVPPSMVHGKDTFALRVKGDSMRDDGILSGDLVIVRKQATARNGQTVIAVVNQEATVKTYYRKEGRIELHPANPSMQPILVSPRDEFRIEGIVVGVIRHY
jgi:repressor LexA